MAGQKQGLRKSLPKRCVNDKLKERRAASWKRGQERKAARRQAQKLAEARNRQLRAQGLPTPWEAAKERARALKSSAGYWGDGLVQL